MRRKSPVSFSLSNQFSHGAGSANIRYSILPPPILLHAVGAIHLITIPVLSIAIAQPAPPPPLLGGGIIVAGCCTCRQVRHRGINHNIFVHEKHLGGMPRIRHFELGGRYLPLLLKRVYFSANLYDGCHWLIKSELSSPDNQNFPSELERSSPLLGSDASRQPFVLPSPSPVPCSCERFVCLFVCL